MGKIKILVVIFIAISSFLILSRFPVFKTNSAEDITPPDITSFVLDKNEVNTESGDVTVTITLRASDDISGIDSISGSITSVVHETQVLSFQPILLEGACDDLDEAISTEGLVGCGDAMDGIYQTSVTFLRGSAIGEWRTSFQTADGLLNYGDITFSSLESEFGVGSAKIDNIASTEDSTGPVMLDYSFDKVSINTEEGTDTLVLTARISDNMSGVATNQYVRFYSPSDVHLADFTFELQTGDCVGIDADIDVSGLTGCGDNKDGIYIATAIIPQFSAKGVWNAEPLVLSDNLGNQSSDESFSATFTNAADVEDITPPVLKSLSMTPTEFDASEGDVAITVTIGAEDAGVGILSADMSIKPLISSQTAQSLSFERISGTINDGVFTLGLTIPKDSKVGLWSIGIFSVSDSLGNSTTYDALDLAALLPDLEIYLVNQALADEVTIEQKWILEESYYRDESHNVVYPDISVKFDADTVVTKEAGGSFAFNRMVGLNYDIEDYAGLGTLFSQANGQQTTDIEECNESEGCVATVLNDSNLVGQPLQIIKMGIPGLNLLFSKPVTVTLRVDAEYLGTTFAIQTFDGNGWVDQTTCLVGYVAEEPDHEEGGDEFGLIPPDPRPACRFTTTHASYFSANFRAGVPDTGFGGLSNNWLFNLLEWLK
ncbi:hypothetical protein M0R04_02695 [Candidatus Dojkabacteria bacterium]|jgi:hypothetical protein|nr:hypothetical protein [Candidatus Dojkabacteria bacterium]